MDDPATLQDTPRRARQRRPGRRLLGWSAAYLLAVVALWVVESLVAEWNWATAAVTYLPQAPFAAPAVVLLAVAALRRARAAAAITGASVAILLWGPLGLRLGVPASARAGERSLRVMTYNIHGGREGVANVAAEIRAEDADVVCLQEADISATAPGGATALGDALPGYRIVRHGSTAVAARLPLKSWSVLPLQAGTSRRAALRAEIDADGRRIVVYCVHLATAATGQSIARHCGSLPEYVRKTSAVRGAQVSSLLRLTRAESGPYVVCGDFNTPPRGLYYRRLSAGMRDAFAERGLGFGYTYPSGAPLLRIDYVFSGGGATPLGAGVPRVHASDHRPVVAELAIP